MSDIIVKQLDELNKKADEAVKAQEKAQKEADEKIKAAKDEAEAAKKEAAEAKAKSENLEKEVNQIKLDSAKFQNNQPKSFKSELKESLEKGIADYRAKGGLVEVQMKAAIQTSDFTNDSTNNTRVIGEMREAGINKLPKRTPWLRQLAFNGSATSDTISWTEKVSETGNPIPLAELDTYPEEKSAYQQFSTQVKKIGGTTKVTEEKLSDVEWLMNEIQAELVQRHDLVVDTQLLSGDGTGANLKGLLEYVTDFAAGSFAAKVADANKADVLRVAYNQIIIEHFNPSAIVLHPSDVAFMELEKNANGDYILPPFVSANGMTVKGLPVIENVGIGEGNFLVGDFSRLGVFAKGGAMLEIGRTGNDFITDQVTVKLRERLAVRVKGQDLKAFVYGDFDSAIAAIDKP